MPKRLHQKNYLNRQYLNSQANKRLFSLFYEDYSQEELEAEYMNFQQELSSPQDKKYSGVGTSPKIASIEDLVLIEGDASIKNQDHVEERIHVIRAVQIPLLQKMLM